MKLSIFDRILLVLLALCAVAVSVVLFGMALNLITMDIATGFISVFYAVRQNMWILAGAGIVLLLVAVKLLFTGRSKSTAQPSTTLIRQSEIGGSFITLSAIDNMAQKYCRAQSRIKECFTNVHPNEDGGVSIGVRLSVMPDTDIVSLTEELQKSLKEYIESYTGITVKEVGILIENMTGGSASGAPARVE